MSRFKTLMPALGVGNVRQDLIIIQGSVNSPQPLTFVPVIAPAHVCSPNIPIVCSSLADVTEDWGDILPLDVPETCGRTVIRCEDFRQFANYAGADGKVGEYVLYIDWDSGEIVGNGWYFHGSITVTRNRFYFLGNIGDLENSGDILLASQVDAEPLPCIPYIGILNKQITHLPLCPFEGVMDRRPVFVIAHSKL